MSYLNLLQSPRPTVGRSSYLSLLTPIPPAPLPEGALAGSTPFAFVYNALLTTGRPTLASRLTTLPQTRRPLLDGAPLNPSRLVELLTTVMTAWPAHTEPPSIDVVSRAAWAHAFANPAADPWLNALRGWLAEEIVTTVYAASSIQEGALTRVTFASRDRPGERIPHWFVSARAIKAELNAYGTEAMRRIRAAMHALGWRERKCFAWGGRMWGFVRAWESSPL